MQTVRRVVGRSTGDAGCIVQLALGVIAEAREFGLTVKSCRVSRAPGRTTSRYLNIEDQTGRAWHLRISNHYRPGRSKHAPPHFDLVSLDGRSGLAEVRRYLVDIVSGEAQWWDRALHDRKPRLRRRRNCKRFIGKDRRT